MLWTHSIFRSYKSILHYDCSLPQSFVRVKWQFCHTVQSEPLTRLPLDDLTVTQRCETVKCQIVAVCRTLLQQPDFLLCLTIPWYRYHGIVRQKSQALFCSSYSSFSDLSMIVVSAYFGCSLFQCSSASSYVKYLQPAMMRSFPSAQGTRMKS